MWLFLFFLLDNLDSDKGIGGSVAKTFLVPRIRELDSP
jgi:hypothetical protein